MKETNSYAKSNCSFGSSLLREIQQDESVYYKAKETEQKKEQRFLEKYRITEMEEKILE